MKMGSPGVVRNLNGYDLQSVAHCLIISLAGSAPFSVFPRLNDEKGQTLCMFLIRPWTRSDGQPVLLMAHLLLHRFAELIVFFPL